MDQHGASTDSQDGMGASNHFPVLHRKVRDPVPLTLIPALGHLLSPEPMRVMPALAVSMPAMYQIAMDFL